MDQVTTTLIERFGVLGFSVVALAYISRWFMASYERKEERLTKLLDDREREIQRLVQLIDERETAYRADIKELSDKFINSLERISATIDSLTQRIEALSTDVRALKKGRRSYEDSQ